MPMAANSGLFSGCEAPREEALHPPGRMSLARMAETISASFTRFNIAS